jgi:hypothetical protein
VTRSMRDDGRRPTRVWLDLGGSGKFKSWQLDLTEYFVRHCGHPTANYPWYGLRPDGSMITSGPGGVVGFAFRYLDDAKVACELDEAGRRVEIGLFAQHRTKKAVGDAQRVRRNHDRARRSA